MGLTIANPVREIKKFSIFQSKVECLIKPGFCRVLPLRSRMARPSGNGMVGGNFNYY
jgi:hypothetical protein